MKNLLKKLLNFKLHFALAIVSFFSYWIFLGLKLSIIFMIIVGVHELGHLIVMKIKEVKTNGFIYIPFVGGVCISIYDSPIKSYKDYFYIAAGGAALGNILNLILCIVFMITRNRFILDLLLWNSVFNLANIIPLPGFDGNKMMNALLSKSSYKTRILVMLIFILTVTIIAVTKLSFIAALATILYLLIISYPYINEECKNKTPEWLKDAKSMSKEETIECIVNYIVVLLAYTIVILGCHYEYLKIDINTKSICIP